MPPPSSARAWFPSLALLTVVGCSSSSSAPPSGGSGGSPEQTGSSCTAPKDCYPDLDGGSLDGTVECLSQVTGGYCTHQCQTDTDCCAVPGECKTNIPEVCSPFESTGLLKCFLSCEDSVIAAAAVQYDGGTVTDSNQYCQLEANPAFTCRSTGGGSKNRKVCLP